MCLAAVQRSGYALKDVPSWRLTPELCDILDAFEQKRMRPVRQTA